MNHKKMTVMVTGIGGNVGQGILRVLKQFDPSLVLIGTDIAANTVGSFFCDRSYVVPYAYDSEYKVQIHKICTQENVDIILPSTDYEVYHLAQCKEMLPKTVMVPVCDHEVSQLFLDKYKTHQAFVNANIPFLTCELPSEYKGKFDSCVVKPREGRGSRNIFMNAKNPNEFSDDYVVQNMGQGKEITTTYYYDKNHKMHACFSMSRKLVNGMTSECEVFLDFQDQFEKIGVMMQKAFPLVGSINLQSLVAEDGSIQPFEVNGRISGTNSIRAQLGFNDVAFYIEEYLYQKTLIKPVIQKGSAQRIYMDVIYPQSELAQKNKTGFIF